MNISKIEPKQSNQSNQSKQSKPRAELIFSSVNDIGVDATAAAFGISRESVKRYCRYARNIEPKEQFTKAKDKLLEQIAKLYSETELKQLAGSTLKPSKISNIDISGEVVKIGIMSDTHIGSVFFSENWFDTALNEFHRQKVDLILHAGDVTEGMSNRPDQIYTLDKIGYAAQRDYAIELFKRSTIPIKAIDGNHDRWFIKNSGALIVKDIDDYVSNFEFLGHDEADIFINDVQIRLWHGEDGSSYAHSYRPQKIVESFYGGEKPQVLILGHSHKAIWQFDRNIQTISAGCLSKQSKWMRGKRISAHTGFYIVEMVINDGEIKRFTPSFYPFYK